MALDCPIYWTEETAAVAVEFLLSRDATLSNISGPYQSVETGIARLDCLSSREP